jgi:hypothetical protein
VALQNDRRLNPEYASIAEAILGSLPNRCIVSYIYTSNSVDLTNRSRVRSHITGGLFPRLSSRYSYTATLTHASSPTRSNMQDAVARHRLEVDKVDSLLPPLPQRRRTFIPSQTPPSSSLYLYIFPITNVLLLEHALPLQTHMSSRLHIHTQLQSLLTH